MKRIIGLAALIICLAIGLLATSSLNVLAEEKNSPNQSPAHFKAVSAGWVHTVGLGEDGTVIAWGCNEHGECNVPEGLSEVKTIAAGYHYTLALKEDGTVVAWGSNEFGKCEVPTGLRGVKAIAAGRDFAIALKEDGTVAAWGYDWIYTPGDMAKLTSELTGVKAIAAGSYVAVFLKEDGNIDFLTGDEVGLKPNGVKAVTAGKLYAAVLNEDSTVSVSGYNMYGERNVPEGLTGVKAISASYHMVALKEDGTVVAWGDNRYGQCTVPEGLTEIKAISAGGAHTVALREDGTIVLWGNNSYGQCTVPTVPVNSITPSAVEFDLSKPDDIKVEIGENSGKLISIKNGSSQLASSDYNISGSAVTINKDCIKSAFINSNSQDQKLNLIFNFDHGNDPAMTVNIQCTSNLVSCANPLFDPSNPQDITIKIAGGNLSAIKNGSASLTTDDYSTSGNAITINKSYLSYYFNKFNLPKQKLNLTFDFDSGDDPIFTVSRMQTSNFANCDNPVYDASNPQNLTVKIAGDKLVRIKNGTASLNSSDYSISGDVVTIKKSYLSYFFNKFTAPWQRLNLTFDFESGNDPLFTVSRVLITNFAECSNPVFHLSSPQDITINIRGNTLASIKNGLASLNSSDYIVSGNTVTIKKSYLTYFFNKFTDPCQKLSLTFDFEKGNDPLFAVTRGSLFKAIAAGYYHTAALKENGTVVAWGDNSGGQCNIPAGLQGVKAIAAGGDFTVALREDGTVIAWGGNFSGQCNVPSGLNGVKAIVAGGNFMVALKEDGTVVAWGDNKWNQCAVPNKLTGVKEIASGTSHTVALKEDGTVIAWGGNSSNQYTVIQGLTGVKTIAAGNEDTIVLKEDGTIVSSNIIHEGLSGVKAFAIGGTHRLALKEDGTVIAWGSNYCGQCNVPKGLSGVKAIATGINYTVALKDDGTIIAWGENSDGQCNVSRVQ